MAQTLELKIILNAEASAAQRAIDQIKQSLGGIGSGVKIDDAAIVKPLETSAKAAKDAATATKGIGDAATQAATGAGSLADKFAKIGLQTAGITSLATNIEGLSKPFVELDSGLRAIGTLGVKNFQEFGDAALELSRVFPDNAATISNAVAEAVGSGIIKTNEQGKIAIDQAKGFAAQASSLALAGATDIGRATSGLASVMNSYGDSLDKYGDTTQKAAFVSDVLFNTYNLGVTSVGDLASNLSNVTGLAATAGVGIDQVGAAIATMTKQGKQTGVATTQIRSLIQELLAGKDKLAPVLADLQKDFAKQEGVIASTGRAYDKTKTLQQNLKEGNITLQDVTKGIGKVAAAQGKEITNIFGSIEAAQAVLSLSGKNAKVAFEDLEGITKRGTVAEGVDVQAGSIENRMKVLINTVNSGFVAAFRSMGDGATVAIGTISKLAPTISAVTGIKQLIPDSVFTSVTNNAKALGGAFVGAFKDFGGTVLSARISIASFAGNITQAILPAIARIAPTLVTTNAAGALSFAGLGAAAQAAWAAVTGPVGLVVAGIAAVTGAAILLYKNFEPFRNFVDGIWKGIVKAFNDAKPVLAELGKVFTDIGGFVRDTFVGALRGAFDILRGVGNAIVGVLALAFEKLSFVLKPVAGFFVSIGEAARSFISSLFSTNDATKQASVGLKGFEGVLGSLRAGLVNIRAFIGGLAGGLEVLGNTLSSIATNLLNPSEWGKINLSGFFTNFQNAFTSRWNKTWEEAKATAQEGVKIPKPDTSEYKEGTQEQASALDALRKVFAKIKDELAAGANTTQVTRDLKNLFREVNKTQKQGKISLVDASGLENEIQALLATFKKGSDGKDKANKEAESIDKAYTEFLKKTLKVREEAEAATAKSIADSRLKSLEETKAALERDNTLSNTERLEQTIAIERQILEERKKTNAEALADESKKRLQVIGTDLAALLDKSTKLSASAIADFTGNTANLVPEKIAEFVQKNTSLSVEQIKEITETVKSARAAIEGQSAEAAKKTTQEFDSATTALEAKLRQGRIAAALQDELRSITQSIANEQQRRLQTELAQLQDKFRSETLALEIAEARKTSIVQKFEQERLRLQARTDIDSGARDAELAKIDTAQQAALREFEGLENTKLALKRQFTAKQVALTAEQFKSTGTVGREQASAFSQTLGSLVTGFEGLASSFGKRSQDYAKQSGELRKRMDAELATVGRSFKKRREVEKKYAEERLKLEQSLGGAGVLNALGESAANVFQGIAEQQRVAFQEAIAGATSFADIGEDAFLRIGVAAGATLAQAVAQGQSASKAILGVAFDTLNSIIPVLVAQIFGQAFAQLGPVGGAIASGATIAAFTALVAVARSAAGFKQGGLVEGGKHDGKTGRFIRINEIAPEFVVNHSATAKNLTALTEINRRNITVEQYVKEKQIARTPLETSYFIDESGQLQQSLRRVEKSINYQTERLDKRLAAVEAEMHEAARMYSYERKRVDVVIETKDPNLSTKQQHRKALA